VTCVAGVPLIDGGLIDASTTVETSLPPPPPQPASAVTASMHNVKAPRMGALRRKTFSIGLSMSNS
jgi:hypothetical protein